MKRLIITILLCVSIIKVQSLRNLRSRRDKLDKDDGKSSLVFVFDTTGSMLNDLRQVRAGAEMILKTALEESNIIADFVFVPFHDPTVGPATVTKNKEVFKAALRKVDVIGGGDCPEKSLGGINLALSVSRPRSFIYVFTDATASDHKLVGKVLDAVQRKQSQAVDILSGEALLDASISLHSLLHLHWNDSGAISRKMVAKQNVVFVLTGHCNDLQRPTYKVYPKIAAASSGQVFNLNKTNVHQVLNFVRSTIRARNVNLVSAVHPAGYNHTQEIPVDSSLGEVTVSVSGAKPKIKVVNPSGKELVGPPKLIKTLDLSEIMIVKVMKPEPGNWTITVGSEKEYSVKVSGLSNLTFNHGFSVEKPKSLEETSYRPLQGTYNHLLLSLTQTDPPIKVDYIELLTTDGKTMFEVPVKEMGINNTFLADAFLPPNEFFYIAVNGHDQNGQEIRRIGATAVQAKPPDVPYLTAPSKIQARLHEKVVLKCFVESLVPVNAKWTSDSSHTLHKISSLQSTSIEYLIEDMSEIYVGKYTCSADNVAGHSATSTDVTLLVDPPQVSLLPANTTLALEGDLTISCSVFSETPLVKAELIYKGADTVNVSNFEISPSSDGFYGFNKTFTNVSETDRGLYTCVAANKGGVNSKSTYINVEGKPTAQIIGPHTVSKPQYSDMQLVCQVEEATEVQWFAPNGTVVKKQLVNGSLSSMLDVHNVTDDGTWKCTALKGSYGASDAVQLNILIKPRVSIAGERNLTVLVGEIRELECTVQAKPPPRIVWHKETEAFLNCTMDEIEPSVYKSVLTLNSTAEHVNGTYFCFGENSAGIGQDSVSVEERTKMLLVEKFTDQLVQLYLAVELRCVAQSQPPAVATFFHNGTKLSNVTLLPGGAAIQLSSVRFSDLGIYECLLDNGYESLRVEGTLQATGLESPSLSKEPSAITVERGETAIITCRVLKGNPVPKIVWQYKREGQMDFEDVRNEVGIINEEENKVKLPNVTLEHAGLVYRCVAENDVGRDIYDASLIVQYPPELAESSEELNATKEIKIEAGKKIVLNCNAIGNPTPRVDWTKDSEPVLYSDTIYLTNTKDLVIDNATSDESGKYRCNASSPLGSVGRDYEIEVFMKPLAETPVNGTDVEVLKGNLLELTCAFRGAPAPRISWSHNGRSKAIAKEHEHKLSFIANSTDSGEYSCTATNEYGIAVLNYTVDVLDPPSLEHSSELEKSNQFETEIGKRIILNCSAMGNPRPIVLWKKESKPLGHSDNRYLTDTNDLVIRNATVHDSGIYSCIATSRLGSVGRDYTVQVFMKPQISPVETTDVEVVKGQLVELSCPVQGEPMPRISWSHKGKEVKHSAHDHVLRFLASPTDSGVYSCTTSNEYGSDVLNYTINVLEPPQLKQSSEVNKTNKLEVEVGRKVVLSCDAEGNPPPIVVWKKDSKPVPFSENTYLDDTNDLVIVNATVYDAGVYNCNATSPLGSVDRNFTLQVFMQPSIKEPDNKEIEVLEGQLVELTCLAQGSPSPRVIWTHNNQSIKPTARIYGHTLRFVANITDFGDYTCRASNEYGSTVLNYTVYVWVAPYLRPPLLESKSVKVGDDISLQCDAVGFPIPIIIWQFEGEQLTENTTHISFNDIGNMYIKNSSSEHDGHYECVAENLAGVASKAILLRVHEPPMILEDNYTGPYVATVLDTALVIACEVEGKPRPYIMWSKDDYYLDKDSRYEVGTDGSLTIKSPSVELSGDYTCIAINPAGNASRTVPVEIYSVPTVMQSDESQTVVTLVEGENATVECPLRVASNDTIKWYKDAVLISEGKLHLSPVKRSDSSQYACVGRNIAGSRHATLSLQIHWPPTLIHPSDDTELDNYPDIHSQPTVSSLDSLLIPTNNSSLVPITLSDTAFPTHPTNSLVSRSVDEGAKGTLDSKPEEISHIRLPRGDDLRLDCAVDAKPRAKTKWYFNSKLLLGEDGSQLKVLNVQLRNTGVYKCVASNQYGTVSKQFLVDVLVPPFISEFDVLDVQLKEGANASLECNAQGSPKPVIKWTFNNTSWREQNGTLTSVNMTADSEGVFRCDATNPAGAAHLVYRVTIVRGAIIKAITAFNGGVGATVTDGVEIALGLPIRIACNALGRPVPTIQWIRHGNVVSSNNADINYVDLEIEKAKLSDAGQYSCVASNEGGVDEKKIKIDVIEPPRILRTLFEDDETSMPGNTINLEVMSGQAFYMHCHPYGSPVPEIYWFKDDVPLKLFDETMISTDYGEIVQSSSAKYEQSGNYTCIARNKAAETSLVYLVDVLVPPTQPKESAQNVNTKIGKQLTLTCPVQGSPMPYVMWMKHPYNEISNDTPRVHLTDDNVTLTIQDSVIDDSGIYSCVMTNKVGTSEVTFNVVIEKAPSISNQKGNNTPEENVIPLRRSIVLKCEVDGHPMPKISWLKDIQAVREGRVHIQQVLGGSVLSIWRAEARDAGQYICVAENSAGAASKRFNVRVKVPGKWSTWSQWSYCNVTCGLGYQNRSRICHYLDDENNTIDTTSNMNKLVLDESSCKGLPVDRRKCHMPPCENDDGWSGWSRWSACSASCGTGTQARSRRCRSKTRCQGDNMQIRKCLNLPKCPRPEQTSHEGRSQESNETDMYTPGETIEMQPDDFGHRRSSDPGDFYTASDKKARVYYDVNVTENLDKSPQGPCKPGFRHNAVNDSCEDVDECSIESNSCHSTQICLNMAGGYRCSCPRGFLSLSLGQRCLDVNECEQEIHGCEFACVNVAGGYVCACPRHLRLHVDRHHCVPPSQYKRPLPYYMDTDYDEYLSVSMENPRRHIKYPKYF